LPEGATRADPCGNPQWVWLPQLIGKPGDDLALTVDPIGVAQRDQVNDTKATTMELRVLVSGLLGEFHDLLGDRESAGGIFVRPENEVADYEGPGECSAVVDSSGHLDRLVTERLAGVRVLVPADLGCET
jgi:hypothetical protein